MNDLIYIYILFWFIIISIFYGSQNIKKRETQNIFVPWEKFIDENNNTNAIREQLALYCSASTRHSLRNSGKSKILINSRNLCKISQGYSSNI